MWIYLCKTVCDNCKTLHFLLQQIAATIVKSLLGINMQKEWCV